MSPAQQDSLRGLLMPMLQARVAASTDGTRGHASIAPLLLAAGISLVAASNAVLKDLTGFSRVTKVRSSRSTHARGCIMSHPGFPLLHMAGDTVTVCQCKQCVCTDT